MASGLETLCGQAYGAEQHQKFGMQIHTAIFSLVLMCIPLAMIWFNMERILILIGQDPLISHEAGKFTIWLVPGLFAYAIQQPLVRYSKELESSFALLSLLQLCSGDVPSSLDSHKLRGRGLWIGIQIGAFVQTVLLSVIYN
ncbi:hypothetical protein PIB30_031280 [Stylosanthes scabra]|uniref:Uncharacterized protein n=1 Tax=Stylosanthes scabra TaxID=79078 RepID=A0ABU6YCF8_9FABA|nr:hypothetical protein [Stylosanthes scabra]